MCCDVESVASVPPGLPQCFLLRQRMQACECVDGWNHTEGRCSINHMEMKGCPQLESLRRCDGSATQSWCETTFTKCREQGYVRTGAPGPRFCWLLPNCRRYRVPPSDVTPRLNLSMPAWRLPAMRVADL